MAVAQDEIDFALELFAGLGGLTTRNMMGGLCIYRDGTIFSIIHGDGRIYIKTKGALVDDLEAEGAERWTYSRDGKKATGMPYWTLPEAALDDPEIACAWAQRALDELGG